MSKRWINYYNCGVFWDNNSYSKFYHNYELMSSLPIFSVEGIIYSFPIEILMDDLGYSTIIMV